MKKLLILGGKPFGSFEITEYAKKLGIYTIVTDYLPLEKSPAKQIADEYWDLSTADLDLLEKEAKKHGVNGVVSGVHEFNIRKSIELSELLNLPTYCTLKQWDMFSNKKEFKGICEEYGLNVAETYIYDDDKDECIEGINYPVITKPVDSSGSRGFSICNNYEELKEGYAIAKRFSKSKQVIVEQFIEHESVVVYYDMNNGKIDFVGLADKYPKKFGKNGSYIAGLHNYPSVYTNKYLEELDQKVKNMFIDLGLKNGSLWIEIFYSNGTFIFNEMGYRFSGSLTFYPIEYLYNKNQLARYILGALNCGAENTEILTNIPDNVTKNMRGYCILPVQLKPGTVREVKGIEEASKIKNVIRIATKNTVGDRITQTGTGQQTFGFIHIAYKNTNDMRRTLKEVMQTLKVLDLNNENILFSLFDIDKDPIRT